MFAPSTTPFVSAVQQIADAAGVSADAEMTNRAAVSLNAAIHHFNNRYKWNWLWTVAPPIQIYAPFTVTGVTASAGSVSVTAAGGHGILVDDLLSGSLFGKSARVTATAASSFSMNMYSLATNGTASTDVTVTRDYYNLPSDYRTMFSVRLQGNDRPLTPMPERFYDRTVTDEFTAEIPMWYSTFQVGTKGKIRLLPPPGGADYLQIKYYRAMATATASGSTMTLDIAADYEPYLIAWGKWHFLMDKGDGREKQATTWLSLAEDGLKTMLKDQTSQPDDDLGFYPGAARKPDNINSTRDLGWTYS